MGDSDPWRNRIVGSGEEAPDQLVANPLNWRVHPGAQRDALRGSLGSVGWVQQVLVNQRTGHVVDGHARVEEALSRGEATVPVLYVDLNLDGEAIVLATLDPISAMATTDEEKLRELLADVTVDDAGLAALLDNLAPSGSKAGLTDPDDAPDLGEETHIKAGDLFALGDHRLMCGDSTDSVDVVRVMAGEKAPMVFTDPPYGVNATGKGGDAIAGDISFTAIPLMFDVFAEVVAPGAWVYVCGGQSNMLLYAKMFERHFRSLPRMIVWDKGKTAVMRHNGYHSCYEIIYYAFREGGGGRWFGGRGSDDADDLWRVDVPGNDRVHMTQKPVELPARAMRNSSQPGDIVYDPFLGSGTTIIAAEQLNRRCYAMEIDPRYVAVAIKRWEDFTGKTSERLDG